MSASNIIKDIESLRVNCIIALAEAQNDVDTSERRNEIFNDLRELNIMDYEDEPHTNYLLKCTPDEAIEYALSFIGGLD